LVFFVLFDQICTTLLICISNHAFLVCFKYKCHIINFLLTSLARYVQRNIGPQSFCTNLALRARSVQRRPRSDISLYIPRVRLIRSYHYMASITSGEMVDCDWLRSTFSGPLFSPNGPAVHYVKTNACI
jgi:hypothetical protein